MKLADIQLGLPSAEQLKSYRIWDSYFTPAYSHPGADGSSALIADVERSLPAIRKGQFEKLCYFPHVGIGTTNVARAAFFSSVQLMLSGHLFSFSDLENGVLRGNRRAPYALSDPFGTRGDPRLPLALARPDCRIHFALNCGAKSCPPVKHFTAAAIAEELRIVALSFCEQEGNVRLEKATLHLSKILYWYRGDFAPSNAKLPAAVLPFLRGETKEALQGLVEKSAVKVKFLDYDWGTNASEFVPFDSSVLSPNETGIFTAFSS